MKKRYVVLSLIIFSLLIVCSLSLNILHIGDSIAETNNFIQSQITYYRYINKNNEKSKVSLTRDDSSIYLSIGEKKINIFNIYSSYNSYFTSESGDILYINDIDQNGEFLFVDKHGEI